MANIHKHPETAGRMDEPVTRSKLSQLMKLDLFTHSGMTPKQVRARRKYMKERLKALGTRGVWKYVPTDLDKPPEGHQGLNLCHTCGELYWVVPEEELDPAFPRKDGAGMDCGDCRFGANKSGMVKRGRIRAREKRAKGSAP